MKTFIEEELERERRLREQPEARFQRVLNHFRKILNNKSESYSTVEKEISTALAARKYGLIYPTMTDEPQQCVYIDGELSGEDALKYLESRSIVMKRR